MGNVVYGKGDAGGVRGAEGGVEGVERTGSEGFGSGIAQVGRGIHVGEDVPGGPRLGVGGASKGMALGGGAGKSVVNARHGGYRQEKTYGEPILSICADGETTVGWEGDKTK